MKGKLTKGLVTLSLLVGIAIPSTAFAATGVIQVDYKLLKEDKKTVLTGYTLDQVTNAAGDVLEKGDGKDYKEVDSDTLEFKTAGAYAITLKKDGNYVTLNATAKSAAKASVVSAVVPEKDTVDVKKSGAAGGIIDQADDSVKVKLVSKTVTYSTYASDEGTFKIYAPAGKYDLVIGGISGYQSTLYPITITAGQTAAPLADLTAKGTAKWASASDNSLKLVVDTITAGTKTITGTVYSADYTIKAVTTNAKDEDTVTVAKITKPKTGSTDLPKFSIAYKTPLSGQTVKLIVSDKAGNTFTTDPQEIDVITIPGLVDPLSTTRLVYGDALSITVNKDTYGLMTTANTVVKVTYDGVDSIYNGTSGKFTVSGSKVNISKGVLPKGTSTIEVSTDYLTLTKNTITTTFYGSKAKPQALSVTKTTYGANKLAAPGEETGTTQITLSSTKTSGSDWVYKVSDTNPTAPLVSDPVPSGTSAFTNGEDITASVGKFVLIYEVKDGEIQKYVSIAIQTGQVKS